MTNILILEDNEERINYFLRAFVGDYKPYVTKDANEANELLSKVEFDYIFLDHDLVDIYYTSTTHLETTGLKTAKFLGKNPQLSPNSSIIIHSLNYDGARNMKSAINRKGVQIIPFTSLPTHLIV